MKPESLSLTLLALILLAALCGWYWVAGSLAFAGAVRAYALARGRARGYSVRRLLQQLSRPSHRDPLDW